MLVFFIIGKISTYYINGEVLVDIEKVLEKIYELNITGISDDTRYLNPGDLFVCLKGDKYDGKDFAIEATHKGAKAILSETEINASTIPVIVSSNIRKNFDVLLAKYYDYPFREIRMIGVTGTDGKTTTASYIEYLLNLKYKCAYIGTNGIRYNQTREKSSYTTLPLCLLMKVLRKLANQNIRYLAMEVSSEGLINNRLESIEFDVAIFTNLSHEHLDTHKTMENYFQAKMKLFEKLSKNGLALANGDCEYSYRINHPKLITFGIDNVCDYQIINIRKVQKYTVFDLKTPNLVYKNIKVNVFEKYNLYNILAAIIVALHYKIPMNAIFKAVMNLPKIEGRLELLTTIEDFQVYVDFAHTPNALQNVLTTLKKDNHTLKVVLGSAGGKDKSKRPLMGKIATEIADYVYFTSEDPRMEDPTQIISELLQEVTKNNYEIIIDRKEAIQKAIMEAKKDDIIIITGKGNDNYFEINNKIYQYSDIYEVIVNLEKKKKLIEK